MADVDIPEDCPMRGNGLAQSDAGRLPHVATLMPIAGVSAVLTGPVVRIVELAMRCELQKRCHRMVVYGFWGEKMMSLRVFVMKGRAGRHKI